MRLAILSSLVVMSLAAVTGCGTATRHSAGPAAPTVADCSNDPSYAPPGETFSYEDTHLVPTRKAAPTTVMKPNKEEVPRGQLHAATY